MRLVIYIASLLFAASAAAQFTQAEEKGKVEFTHADKFVKKPKYDSLIFGDTGIVTAYKKDKVYYINTIGKVIHKGKFCRTNPFIKGPGILKNRRGKYGLMTANGEFLMEYSFTDKPIKYGQIVYVGGQFRNRLFNADKLLEKNLDTINTMGNWLVSTTITKEKYTRTINRRLLPDKKEIAYRYHHSHKLYNAEKGTLTMDDISSFETYANNLLIYKATSPFGIYAMTGANEIENLQEFKIIDLTYFSIIQDEKRGLYSTENLSPIIAGAYDLFLFKTNTIYALGDTTNQFPALAIYDYTGKRIKTDLQYVSDLDENRFVFAQDSLQFIGTEFGEQLSGFHHGFGATQNGYRFWTLHLRLY